MVSKPIDSKKPNVSFVFEDSFLVEFNSMISSFDKSFDELCGLKNSFKENYGVCNCSYKMRYITPENVSTYVSNLAKALTSGILNSNINDIEMFTVASVKRFIEENNCVPFEDSTMMGNIKYINPKTYTLQDLLALSENDIYSEEIYSCGELNKRYELIQSDIENLHDFHFVPTMKNIVKALPGIIERSADYILEFKSLKSIFTMFVEKFILFACYLNNITILSMISYCSPRASYDMKKNSVDDTGLNVSPGVSSKVLDVVTECCLLKTNDLVIKNKIPFNCNMRDIVLQDVNPKFKDTESALNFIVKDSRSPISILLNKYLLDDKSEYEYCNDIDFVTRLLFNQYSHNGTESSTSGTWYTKANEVNSFTDPYDNSGCNTDVNWLDTITYGNNFLDCNYRKDAVGNNKFSPIMNTLDTIYKLFNTCSINTNKDLSLNIMRIYNIMKSIIKEYPNGNIPNHELVRDVLCVLGEIFTRSILKLYKNNTRVIDCSDNMNDTMIPGYLYTESFVMEAEGDDKTPNGSPKPTVSVDSIDGKSPVKMKISNLITKFKEWIINALSKFSAKFNEDHKREIEWIKKNTELNNKIGAALENKSFRPQVKDMPMYDIPAQDILNNIKVADVVNKWLNSQEAIDPVTVKKELYPGGEAIAAQIANMKSEKDEIAALSNYILYKQITPKPNYSDVLTKRLWDGLIKDLLETGRLIESSVKKISEELKKATETLQNKTRQGEVNKSNGNDQGENNNVADRASQLFNIVQTVSRNYHTTLLNTLRSKFYSINYKLYRDIVTIYNQQQNQNNVQNQQQTM